MTQFLLPALLCGILARYFSLRFVLLLNVKHRFPQTPVPKTMNLILVSDLLNYYLHRRNRHVAQPHVQTNYYGLLLPMRHALLATYNCPCSIPWNMYWCAYIITLVSWCHLRRIRRRNEIIFFFSCLQLDVLRSLKMNSTMNIVDNYRPVQNLGSRKVKSSLSSTQAASDYYRCSCPNRSCKRCSQNIQCPFDVGALSGRSFLPLNDLQDQALCLRRRRWEGGWGKGRK